jgi:hypothetical protein
MMGISVFYVYMMCDQRILLSFCCPFAFLFIRIGMCFVLPRPMLMGAHLNLGAGPWG